MINKFLHAATNRAVLSGTPMFVSDPSFTPAALTLEAQQLRSALCLDSVSDYYLRAYAALIEAHPDMQSYLGDYVKSYRSTDFLPRGVKTTGASLLSSDHGSGFFTDPAPTSLPLALTYEISFAAASMCNIKQVETSQSYQAVCQVTTDPNRSLMRVEWPEAVPFDGMLQLRQPWVSGAFLTIEVSPSQFPYAAAVAAVKSNSFFIRTLQQLQVDAEFHNTADPQDQLALALAVIARSNKAVYPD